MNQAEDIVCFESGSNQLPWVGSIESLGTDQEAIRQLALQKVIELHEDDGQALISGLDSVGMVLLPTGRRLFIQSKIRNLTLLEWLAYLGDFPPLESWIDEVGVSPDHALHECLAKLFLHEIDQLTRVHLRKDYVLESAHDSTVRGRVVTSQLCRQLHRLPHIPQRQRTRTLDTPQNKVLALALDKLPQLLMNSSEEDQTALNRLRQVWSAISRESAAPSRQAAEAQWACPQGYRTALQLARLLIDGATLDAASGYGGNAFTMSLALMWERIVGQIMRDTYQQTGWRVCSKSKHTRLWDDSVAHDDSSRWLTADVMAEFHDFRWVLDAKYKRAFGKESRVDRFQMCAYALAFDAPFVSLIYPSASQKCEERVLLRTTVGSRRITINSINLPMSAGPVCCKNALLDFAKTLASKLEASTCQTEP